MKEGSGRDMYIAVWRVISSDLVMSGAANVRLGYSVYDGAAIYDSRVTLTSTGSNVQIDAPS